MQKNLSQLKEVELKEIWKHEAYDFTTWLAQQENLDLLSKEIGIGDIKLIQTEASVGHFRVDILAEEQVGDKIVIIENQLQNTDHDHLGKIITYASGYNAEIVIWIVRDVREEHKRAIDWLNEHIDESISFFLIKIEVWQIEDSPPAPKFKVIVSPNEWAKIIRTSSKGGELTQIQVKDFEFWTQFKEYVRKSDKRMNLTHRPYPQNFYDIPISQVPSDRYVSLTINSVKNLLGCAIYITRNKPAFNFLHERKNEIEKEIGESLKWIDAPVDSRILIDKAVPDVFDKNRAEEYFVWFYEKTLLFQKVFGRHLMEFKE